MADRKLSAEPPSAQDRRQRIVSEAVIRPIGPAHLSGAVHLHKRTFPHELLTRLGSRAIVAVYRTYIESPRCIGFVAVQDAEVTAVACGVMGPGFLMEVLRRHPLAIGGAAVSRLLRHPTSVRGLLHNVLSPRGVGWEGDPVERFYWRVIMIDPTSRGRGLMMPLVQNLLQEARGRGASDVCSATHDHNLPMVWVQRVFGFESRPARPGLRYYRLDLRRSS